MDLISTYKGKNVFITGHTGFIGSWLSLWLSELGANIYGYSQGTLEEPNNYTLSDVKNILNDEIFADIRDKNTLNNAIKKSEPDYIFHLAAQPIVRLSYQYPIETFETNVIGSLNVLESLRNLEQSCTVIMATSDKCYDNKNQIWGYREMDPLGGHDPYSASKAAAEIAIASYRDSFFQPSDIEKHGIKISSVRAGNVIGGGDWAKDRIIPDAVKAISKGELVQVRNPYAVRPWQHVLEPLHGYLKLGAEMFLTEKPELCSSWNFGPYNYDECSVSVLMDLFCEEWGNVRWEHRPLENEVKEASILRLSIDKAVNKLQWKPVWNLKEALKRTVNYYKEYYSKESNYMADTCYKDINEYMDMI